MLEGKTRSETPLLGVVNTCKMNNLIDALTDKKPDVEAPEEPKPAKKKRKKSSAKPDELDVELGLPQGMRIKSAAMKAFFKDVEEVKQAIYFLRGQTKEIVELSDKAVNAIGDRSEKECSIRLESIIKTANGHASKARVLLQHMRIANEGPAPGGKRMKSSERRIRRALLQALTQKFIEVGQTMCLFLS